MGENPYEVKDGGMTPPPVLPPPIPGEAPKKEPWDGWWTLLWGFTVVLCWVMAQTFILFVILLIGEGIPTSMPEFEDKLEAYAGDGDVLGTVAFLALFVACPMCWFCGKIKPLWSGMEYLGSERVVWWKWLMWSGIILVTMMVLGAFAQYMKVETPESMQMMRETSDNPIWLILGVVVGAPLVEEFIFRGLLFRGWKHSPIGAGGTIILTSILWAMLHQQYEPILIGNLFILGLVLGAARHYTGNVWVPVVMHAMHAINNGLAVVSMFWLSQ